VFSLTYSHACEGIGERERCFSVPERPSRRPAVCTRASTISRAGLVAVFSFVVSLPGDRPMPYAALFEPEAETARADHAMSRVLAFRAGSVFNQVAVALSPAEIFMAAVETADCVLHLSLMRGSI